jgi:hypothetical protein
MTTCMLRTTCNLPMVPWLLTTREPSSAVHVSSNDVNVAGLLACRSTC